MADGSGTRIPAQNLDAEASVLSTVLLDGADALAQVREVLGDADWYSDSNRQIWGAAVALEAEGRPIDVVTIAERLRNEGRLAQVGGTPYLALLQDAIPSVANLEAHARIIATKARQRAVTKLGHELAAEGYEHRDDVDSWAQTAAQKLTDIAVGGQERDPAESFDALIPRVMQNLTARARGDASPRTVATGWKRYDYLLGGGYERGQVHIVAGRPGMGKTSFLMCAALHVASKGLGAIFVSAEMPKEQLAQRALAIESGVSVSRIRRARMAREEWDAVAAAANRLRKMPIVLRYRAGARVSDVSSCLLRESRKLGVPIGLGLVDYIQLLDDEREHGQSRESALSRVSQRLCWTAGRYDVPLMVGAQINRSVESRANANKRPGLADLRESGSLEQDAYSVTFLYRDEYYNEDSEWKGTAEAIIAKNRDGETGYARLAFLKTCTRFADIAGEDDPQEELY